MRFNQVTTPRTEKKSFLVSAKGKPTTTEKQIFTNELQNKNQKKITNLAMGQCHRGRVFL